jgi:hypothetical protein
MNDFFIKFYDDNLVASPYPSYHKGRDLEEHFINFYFENKEKFDSTGYTFLPIKWTNIFNIYRNLIPELQDSLNKLDRSKKYFTVSQHDDAPYLELPPNTLNFAAGGNIANTIPIPLICSGIENIPRNQKDIFCSFVGSVSFNIGGMSSLSHNIRMKMLSTLVNNKKYLLKPKHWSSDISTDRESLFFDITSRSKFTLCPRGYGSTSFRLYEAMQLGSVPVYIYYNEPFLPWKDQLDWNRLCILVDFNDIDNIDNILSNITDEKYSDMLKYIEEIYPTYFTLDSLGCKILTKLKCV